MSFKEALSRSFLIGSAIVLGFASASKIVALFTLSQLVLSTPNPLFLFLSERWVIAGAALLESVSAGLIVFSRDSVLRYRVLTWICGVMWLYRLGLAFSGDVSSCGCLAGAQEIWGLSTKFTDLLALILLGLLTGGGDVVLGSVVVETWGIQVRGGDPPLIFCLETKQKNKGIRK